MFKLEVTESTAQRQIAVHTVELHETTRVEDTRVLLGVAGLVVVAHRLRLTGQAQHTARVTRVRAVHPPARGRARLGHQQRSNCRTAGRVVRVDGVFW